MLQHPRRLLGLSIIALALLPAAFDAAPAAALRPGEAGMAEGRTVRVEGVVTDLRRFPEGTRLTLAADGEALEVRVEGDPGVGRGAWAVAEGRLLRQGGALRLWVEDPAAVQALAAGDAAAPAWPELAADPSAWTGQPLRLGGTVDRGELRAAGHALRLGDGAWPQGGPVTAEGVLLYDPSCLCHRLHAARVTPWTP